MAKLWVGECRGHSLSLGGSGRPNWWGCFFVNAEIPLPSSDAGNLPEGVPERELEDEFGKFGVLRKVWVARKPSGFGE